MTIADRGLLFDRHPGYPTASQMLWQRDWPSTDSLYAEPERVYYRETIHDVQGLWPYAWDHMTRRFDVYREGSGTRR